ncbi:MAG: polymerase subunit alpha [Candidatus Parcubacteria bacterium]
MLSEDEVQQIMLNSGYDASLIDTMIQNTANIAASIHIDISLGKAMFPKYQSPPYIEQLFARYQ